MMSKIYEVEVSRCHDQLVPEDRNHPAIEVWIVIGSLLSFKSRSTELVGYCYKRANYLQIYQELFRVHWSHLHYISNINVAFDYLYSQIDQVLDEDFPLKKKKIPNIHFRLHFILF